MAVFISAESKQDLIEVLQKTLGCPVLSGTGLSVDTDTKKKPGGLAGLSLNRLPERAIGSGGEGRSTCQGTESTD